MAREYVEVITNWSIISWEYQRRAAFRMVSVSHVEGDLRSTRAAEKSVRFLIGKLPNLANLT